MANRNNPLADHLEQAVKGLHGAMGHVFKTVAQPPQNMTEAQTREYAKQINNPDFIKNMKGAVEGLEELKGIYEKVKTKM